MSAPPQPLQQTLSLLPQRFCVCRISPTARQPDVSKLGNHWSMTRTPEELSIVVEEHLVQPSWSQVSRGWRCLKVQGPLELGMIGVLAELSATLAAAKVSLFAVSTFDTDYLWVQQDQLADAMSALRDARYRVTEPTGGSAL